MVDVRVNFSSFLEAQVKQPSQQACRGGKRGMRYKVRSEEREREGELADLAESALPADTRLPCWTFSVLACLAGNARLRHC